MAIQYSFINATYSKIKQTILVALGYTPENVANKTSSILGISNVKYPTEKAVADFLTDAYQSKLFYDVEIGAFIIEEEEYES